MASTSVTDLEDFHDENELLLGDLLRRIAQKRWVLVLSVIACSALAVAAAYLIKPVYRSTAVLIPASSERSSMGSSLNQLGGLGTLASMAGFGIGSNDAPTEEALAVLQSKEFTEAFIQEHNLLPRLFAKRWDAEHNRWRDPAKQPTLGQGFKYFDKRVRTIIQEKKSMLVTLQIDWRDRIEAAEWANLLVAKLNSEMRARAISNADAAVRYLTAELAKAPEVETRSAISRLIEQQIKQRMLANVSQEYAFRVVDKALPTDADDPIKPQKALLFIVGPLLGLVLGGLLALFLTRKQLPRNR